MESTIYKPSIYKGAGIYKNGANGGGFDPEKDIFLGGELYKGIEINGLIWINRNLNFVCSGINLNPSNLIDENPNCAYYNKANSEPFENAGLLYNFSAARVLDGLLQNFSTGWRVATSSDLNNLKNYANPQAGKKLRAIQYNGTNDFGFSLLASGQCDANGNFSFLNSRCYVQTTTQLDSTHNSAFESEVYDTYFTGRTAWSRAYYPIRLCKSA